ncbi:MAG: hypothetical protein HKM04_10580 [Legionellales bacterium]|nr:hypothetical protein [Legionellales bacterium]
MEAYKIENNGNINLPKNYHIHTTNLKSYGGSNISKNSQKHKKTTYKNQEQKAKSEKNQKYTRIINVENKVSIKDNASIDLKKTFLVSKKLSIAGSFSTDHSNIFVDSKKLNSKKNKQKTENAKNTNNNVNTTPVKRKPIQSISTKRNGQLTLSSTRIDTNIISTNSQIPATIKDSTIETAIFKANSNLNIKKTTINSNLIELFKETKIKKSRVIAKNIFSVKKESNCLIQDSIVNSEQGSIIVDGKLNATSKADQNGKYDNNTVTNIISKNVMVGGKLALDHSLLKTNSFTGKKDSTINGENGSSWQVNELIQLHGQSTFDNNFLNIESLSNYGETDIYNSRVISKKTLYSNNSITFDTALVTAPKLDLGGYHDLNRFVSVDDQGNKSKINDIVQTGESSIDNSDISADFLFTYGDADVECNNNINLKISYASLLGEKMKINNSNVDVNILDLKQGDLSIKNCQKFNVEKNFTTDLGTKLAINRSNIRGGDAIFRGESKVKNVRSQNDNLKIEMNNIVVSGKSEIENSAINAKENLIFDESSVEIKKSKIKSTTFYMNNYTTAEKTEIIGKNITQLTSGNLNLFSSSMRTEKNLNFFGTIEGSKSHIEAKNINVYKKLKADEMSVKSKDKFHLHTTGEFDCTKTGLIAKEIEVNNKVKATDSSWESESNIKFQYGADVESNRLFLAAKKQIINSVTSDIHGNGLTIKADRLENESKIKLSDSLVVDVEVLKNNYGSLLEAKNVKIDANKMLFNLMGRIHGDNVTTTSAISLNMMGDIRGSNNLTSYSLVDLNMLGAKRSYNLSNNSFFSLNGGLMLPTLPNDLSAIFSVSHLMSASRSLLTMALPNMVLPINLAYQALPLAVQGGQALWHGGKNIHDVANGKKKFKEILPFKDIKSWRLKDVLPMALRLKGLAVTGANLATSSAQVYQKFSDWNSNDDSKNWKSLKNEFKWDALKNNHGFSREACLNMLGSVFGPTISTESAFNVNAGVIVSQNVYQNDFCSANFGLESGFQSLTHNSYAMFNFGCQDAGALNMNGRYLYNAGKIKNKDKVYIDFNDINLSVAGEVDLINGLVSGNNSNLDGKIKLENIRMNMKKIVNFSNTTDFFGKNSELKGKEINLAGEINYEGKLAFVSEADVNLETCNVKVKESIIKNEPEKKSENEGLANKEEEKIEQDKIDEAKNENFLYISGENINFKKNVNIHTDGGLIKSNNTNFKEDTSLKMLHFETDNLIQIESGAKVATENVLMKGGDIMHKGELDYRARLELEAVNTLTLADGSALKVEGNEIKEGCVQDNYLKITAKKIDMEQDAVLKTDPASIKGQTGKLAGNVEIKNTEIDFTEGKLEITETCKMKAEESVAKATEIVDNGDITYKGYFGLKSEQALVVGESAKIHVDPETIGNNKDENGNIKNFLELSGEHVYLKKNADIKSDAGLINGKTVDSNATMDVANFKVKGDEKVVIGQSADMKTRDVVIESGKNLEVHGNIDYSGYLGLKAAEELKLATPSKLNVNDRNENNFLNLEGKNGIFNGTVDADKAYVKCESMPDAESLIVGENKYKNFHVSDTLGVSTNDGVNLNKSINRTCGLDLEGHSIFFNTDYQTEHDISLTSNTGDIYVNKNVEANNFYADSKASLYTFQNVQANDTAFLKSELSYLNVGGNVQGRKVYIDASEFKNITRGSEIFESLHSTLQGYAGNGGVVKGEETLIEARNGNIENYGGVLQGTKYLQGITKGDIYNVANISEYEGKYDTISQFDSAFMHGGTGEGHEGVGLYLQAGGIMANVGSTVGSEGTNYINAKKGIESTVLYDSYISYKHKKKKWYGKKKKTVKTSTVVQNSQFISTNGKNIFISEEGGLHAVATDFISESGTSAYTRDNIELYSLIYSDMKETKKESWWGANKSEKISTYENAVPVLIFDHGITQLESMEGSIIGRGVLALGDGDFYTSAKNGSIKFSSDILHHHVHEEKKGFSISIPSLDNLCGLVGQGGKGLFHGLDPLFMKTDKLLHSNDNIEFAANGWNAGIAGYNAYQNINYAVQNNAIPNLVSDQLGITDALSPSLRVTYAEEKSDLSFETTGPGAIHRQNWVAIAKDDITLNGVDVDLANDLSMKAQIVAMNGNELHSSYQHEKKSASVDIGMTGNIKDVNVNHTETKNEAIHYDNMKVNVGGNFHIEANEFNLNAANVDCNTITGKVSGLNITSKQDSYQSKFKQQNVSLSGNIGFFQNKSKGAQVAQVTSLHVREGINHHDDLKFTVDKTVNTGAAITTDGVNKYESKIIENHELKDYHKERSFGFSGNYHDLANLGNTNNKNNSSDTDKPEPIKTMSVTSGKKNFKATHTATFYGNKGNEMSYDQVNGKMNTSNAHGYKIKRDIKREITFDVPVMNPADLMNQVRKDDNQLYEPFFSAEEKNEIILVENINKNDANQENNINDSENNDIHVDASQCELHQFHIDSFIEPLNIESSSEEQSISYADFLDKDKMHELVYLVDFAKFELDSQGEVSQQTQMQFKASVAESVLKIVKASIETGHDKFANAMGDIPGPLKVGFGVNKHILGWVFNIALSDEMNMTDAMYDAALATITDVITDRLYTIVLRGGASPVSWGLLLNEIYDSYTYDPEKIQQSLQRQNAYMGEMKDAVKSNDWFGFVGAQQMHRCEAQQTSFALISHNFAELNRYLSEKIQQGVQALTEMKFKPIITSPIFEYRMFKPEKNKAEKSESYSPDNGNAGAVLKY